MAYDEALADRVRALLHGDERVTERKMFGGLAFLVRGHMVAGILDEELMLRLGKPGAAEALTEPHTRPMDFTGKVLSTMLFVEPAGIAAPADLEAWVRRALAFAESLPPKG